jgi:hypothetical protein
MSYVPVLIGASELLETSHCFLIDCVSTIFAWMGKKASSKEKKIAKDSANGIVERYDRPQWTSVHIEFEGSESTLFKVPEIADNFRTLDRTNFQTGQRNKQQLSVPLAPCPKIRRELLWTNNSMCKLSLPTLLLKQVPARHPTL